MENEPMFNERQHLSGISTLSNRLSKEKKKTKNREEWDHSHHPCQKPSTLISPSNTEGSQTASHTCSSRRRWWWWAAWARRQRGWWCRATNRSSFRTAPSPRPTRLCQTWSVHGCRVEKGWWWHAQTRCTVSPAQVLCPAGSRGSFEAARSRHTEIRWQFMERDYPEERLLY